MHIQLYKKMKIINDQKPYFSTMEDFIPTLKFDCKDSMEIAIIKGKELCRKHNMPAFRIVQEEVATILHIVNVLSESGKMNMNTYFCSLDSHEQTLFLQYKYTAQSFEDEEKLAVPFIRKIIKNYGKNSPQYFGFDSVRNPDRYEKANEVPF